MSLSELQKRRKDLEKLSEYHRVLLVDSAESSAKKFRVLETIGLIAASPIAAKLVSSGAITKFLPLIAAKIFSSKSGSSSAASKGINLLIAAKGIFSVLLIIGRTLLSTLKLLARTLSHLFRKKKPAAQAE